LASLPALADTSYTSYGAYIAALPSAGLATVVNEEYTNTGLFSGGQLIAPGTTLDGLTYTSFVGFTNADITNQYNSFPPNFLSLGADNTGGGVDPAQTFFSGGQGLDVTFSTPVYAAGVLFNVNLNSGSFGFTTDTGAPAFTGSSSFDTTAAPCAIQGIDCTFVFAGIISSTPFSTIAITSIDSDGSYNVPQITAATPEPNSILCLCVGLGALVFCRRFRTA
jgi:hypothetical protein